MQGYSGDGGSATSAQAVQPLWGHSGQRGQPVYCGRAQQPYLEGGCGNRQHTVPGDSRRQYKPRAKSSVATSVAQKITSITAAKSQGVQQEYVVGAITGCTVDGSGSSSNSATTNAGGTAIHSLTLTPGSGATIPDAVTFSATGLPTGATATFSPATIAATGC